MDTGSQSIVFRVIGEIFETGITPARVASGFRISLVQVRNHCLYRAVKTVQIQTVHAYLRCSGWTAIIMRPQPADQIDNVSIAPHPAREAFEIFERLKA